MKKAKKFTIPKPDIPLLVVSALLLGAIAFVLGMRYSLSKLATGTQIEASRKTIIQKFLIPKSIGCSDKLSSTTTTEQVGVFFEYLRINKYANRAVIRGCNNTDQVLMKDNTGNWVETNINLNLDKRVNSAWQKVCLVDDITVADTAVRAENNSIDNNNLNECRYMLRHGTDGMGS